MLQNRVIFLHDSDVWPLDTSKHRNNNNNKTKPNLNFTESFFSEKDPDHLQQVLNCNLNLLHHLNIKWDWMQRCDERLRLSTCMCLFFVWCNLIHGCVMTHYTSKLVLLLQLCCQTPVIMIHILYECSGDTCWPESSTGAALELETDECDVCRFQW